MNPEIWYNTMFYKDPNAKKKPKKDIQLPRNIYGDTSVKTHLKKFHAIHYVFKYKYFVPLLRLGKRLIGKALIKEIPEGNHNRNIRVFDAAFEEAINKWHVYYLRNNGNIETRPTRKEMLLRAKDPKNLSGQSLRDMKDIIITMYLYDTAYREFMNILMHEISIGMHEEYKGKFKTGHLFYTSDNITQPEYFVLEKLVQVTIGLSDAEKLLKLQELQNEVVTTEHKNIK